jgi:hypothetical protein
MPIFRTTKGILTGKESEIFDPNYDVDSPLFLPPNGQWDYKRELQIDDVSIWQVIYEESGRRGLYAAWDPYAEFYMILAGWKKDIYGNPDKLADVESYYGKGAQNMVMKRAQELGFHVEQQKIWVEPEDMWLYEDVKYVKVTPGLIVSGAGEQVL